MQTSKDESDGGVKQEGAVGADEAALTVNNGKRGVEDPKVRSARGRIRLFYNTLAVLARQFEKPNFPIFFAIPTFTLFFWRPLSPDRRITISISPRSQKPTPTDLPLASFHFHCR